MFFNMGSSSGPPLFDHLRSAFPNQSYLDGSILIPVLSRANYPKQVGSRQLTVVIAVLLYVLRILMITYILLEML